MTTTDAKKARDYVASINGYAGWKATSDLPDALAGTNPGQEWDDNGARMRFCWCPPGKYTVGRVDVRQVSVTISSGFWLGKYEVTQAEWGRVMPTTLRDQWKKMTEEHKIRGEGPRFPMYYVSLDEAAEFCRSLTAQERKAGRLPETWEFRLPTAQWEYPLRAGGAKGPASSGDDDAQLMNYAWYAKNSENTQHVVGGKRANAWGIHDMYGNLYEYCRDWHHPEVTREAAPEFDANIRSHAALGGCWLDSGAREFT